MARGAGFEEIALEFKLIILKNTVSIFSFNVLIDDFFNFKWLSERTIPDYERAFFIAYFAEIF